MTAPWGAHWEGWVLLPAAVGAGRSIRATSSCHVRSCTRRRGFILSTLSSALFKPTESTAEVEDVDRAWLMTRSRARIVPAEARQPMPSATGASRGSTSSSGGTALRASVARTSCLSIAYRELHRLQLQLRSRGGRLARDWTSVIPGECRKPVPGRKSQTSRSDRGQPRDERHVQRAEVARVRQAVHEEFSADSEIEPLRLQLSAYNSRSVSPSPAS
jgi:hypothetical protein